MVDDPFFPKEAFDILNGLIFEIRRNVGNLFPSQFLQGPTEGFREGSVEIGDLSFRREQDNR